jgi:hypothetical protein
MRTSATKLSTSQHVDATFGCPGSVHVRRVGELTERERSELSITCSLDDLRGVLNDMDYLSACENVTYWDGEGRELDPGDRVLLPGSAPSATQNYVAERGMSNQATVRATALRGAQ